jgi:hypothetical protein
MNIKSGVIRGIHSLVTINKMVHDFSSVKWVDMIWSAFRWIFNNSREFDKVFNIGGDRISVGGSHWRSVFRIHIIHKGLE